MRTSRRHAIKLGLCASATLATFTFDTLADSMALAGGTTFDDISWLRRDMFEAVVGDAFVLYLPQSGSANLKLSAVQDTPTAQAAGTIKSPDCFEVLLQGSSKTPKLEQGTYRVENRTLGIFSLFLVPGSVTKQGVHYIATFNRVVGA